MPKIYDAKNRSYREVNEYEHRLLMGGWKAGEAAALGALLVTAPDGERGTGRECVDIATGEASLMACPIDTHGFARASTIHVDSCDAARTLLKDAGYSWDAKVSGFVREGFLAKVAYRTEREFVRIYIVRVGYAVALSATESHPEEALEYGR